MIWIGALIVALTFVAIVKRYETRLVLFTAGLVMALLAKNPAGAIDAFVNAMVNGGLVPVICTVMGFSFVMKVTGCDSHLVHCLAEPLRKARLILIPGAALITFVLNIALPSAAGCAAAVGAILIPTLISSGVHPAMAGSAVLAGTWGSVMSPGLSHNPYVAKLAGVDVMTVIANLSTPAIFAAATVAITLTGVAYMRKEGPSDDRLGQGAGENESFRVNYLKALTPVVPLVLLVLGSKQVGVIPLVSVPLAMISGVILAFFITRTNPQEMSKKFFDGMGYGYGNVVGIIIAAAVFTEGMKLIGLTDALIEAMKQSAHIARLAATFGPFFIAVLCGSGDAAALAFNGAITPHAAQFGFTIIDMGSLAQMAGGLGRSMSPVAGSAIVCAQLANVNPLELSKRNAPGMLLGTIVLMLTIL